MPHLLPFGDDVISTFSDLGQSLSLHLRTWYVRQPTWAIGSSLQAFQHEAQRDNNSTGVGAKQPSKLMTRSAWAKQPT